MTRVVGRIGFVAVALSLFAAATANAVMPRLSSSSALGAIPGYGGPNDLRANNFSGSSGFEVAEGFSTSGGNGAPNTISGQPNPGGGVLPYTVNDKWRCLGATASPPRCPQSPPGSLVIKQHGAGSQSAFLTNNAAYPGGTFIGFRTPRLKNEIWPEMNVDLRINDNFGSNYYLGPQHIYTAAIGNGVPARVAFGYNGYIYALNGDTGAFDGPLNNFEVWPANTWFTMVLRFDYTTHRYDFLVGPSKENLHTLGNFGFFSPDTIDDFIFASDNYQAGGFGTFDGDPNGPGSYVDNFAAKPEPGTFALLAAGVLLGLRRRR